MALRREWSRTPAQLLEALRESYPNETDEELAAVVAVAQQLQQERKGYTQTRGADVSSSTKQVRDRLRAYLEQHRAVLEQRGADTADASSWPGPADAWGDLGGELEGLCSKGTFSTYHWPAVTLELAIPKKRGPKSAAAATGQLSKPPQAPQAAAEKTCECHGVDHCPAAASPAAAMGSSIQEELVGKQEAENVRVAARLEELRQDGPLVGLFDAVADPEVPLVRPLCGDCDRPELCRAVADGSRPCDPASQAYLWLARVRLDREERDFNAKAAVTFRSSRGRFTASQVEPRGAWRVTLELETSDEAAVGRMIDEGFRALHLPCSED